MKVFEKRGYKKTYDESGKLISKEVVSIVVLDEEVEEDEAGED